MAGQVKKKYYGWPFVLRRVRVVSRRGLRATTTWRRPTMVERAVYAGCWLAIVLAITSVCLIAG